MLATSNVEPEPPSALRFLLVATLGPALLLAMALWFSGETHALGALRATLSASYDDRLCVTELLRRLAEAEAAQRGFLITGDTAFVASFAGAHDEVEASLTMLDGRFAGEPDQRARLTKLGSEVHAEFADMSNVIDVRQQKGPAAAAALLSQVRGVQLMADARAIADATVSAESRSLADRLDAVRPRNLLIEQIVWLLVVVIGGLLLFGSALLWQSRRSRYMIECEAYKASLRLHAVFAGTIDAIFIIDAEGRIQTVNEAATQMLGYEAYELEGLRGTDLLGMKTNGRSFSKIIGLVDGHLPRTTWLDRTIRHKDGHLVPIDIALGMMSIPNDLHYVAALRDISERKAAERLKDDFVATVSHELRTPLTSVVGSLGLLRGGSVGQLPDAARRLVEIADNNSRRLIRLINDILDIEKIGSGQMHFDREPIDLRTVARRAIDGSEGLAQSVGVRLELAAGESAAMVEGDADKLLQVVTNLLSNAIRFSPSGGQVVLAAGLDSREAVLSVTDQGPGVPAAFEARIFERFSQASGNNLQGGTGLGLAISREIVVAHGGRIWFSKADGGGACFSFALPVAVVSPIERDARHARILVCEDQDDIAEVIRGILEAEACIVDRVINAKDVEEAAQSGRYDGIVLDLVLPDASGLEAVRRLRRRPETRIIPIIVVSAFAYIGASDPSAVALDVIDWINKPVDPMRLVRALRRAIEHSATGRPTLLHVDDDTDMLEVTATALAAQGRMLRATSLASARAVLASGSPDIVILDIGLPDGSGLDLLPELFMDDGSAIPTIIYSASEITPEVKQKVDAVLVKSRRSLPSLALTIRNMLDAVAQEDQR